MPYWKECPRCGSHLDPGERCDCGTEEKEKPKAREVKTIRLSYETKEVKGCRPPRYPCPFR